MTADRKRIRATNGWKRGVKAGAIAAFGLLLLGGCSHLMMMFYGDVEPPPASEFGFGPRVSPNGIYEATIEPTEPLKTRRMHTVKLKIRTPGGVAVEHASIAIDGGMPQHGHGLPTKPRVTRALGAGTYQVDGLKFSMGGWWELKFRITSAAGTDSVTFNLDL